MNKLIFISIILSLTQFALKGQNSSGFLSNESSDPAATAIIEKLHSALNQEDAVLYDFNLKIEIPEDTPQSIEGRLIQRQDMFHLTMSEREIYSDNESMWVYDSEMNVVEIYDADFGNEGAYISPQSFIDLYKSPDYSYALEDQWPENNQMISKIVFKPLSEDSEYFKMNMITDESDTYIKEIKIFAKDGTRYILNFTNIVLSQDYKEDYFVFNTKNYKDIQVENLRID